MTDPNPVPVPREVFEVWAKSFAQVISQIAGSGCEVDSLAQAPAEAAETDLYFSGATAGTLRGELGLRISRAHALALAQTFLQEARTAEAEFSSDHSEAILELLRQVSGHAVTSLKAKWGEVQIRIESGSRPSWTEAGSAWMQASAAAAVPFAIEMQLSAALAAALRPSAEPAAAPAPTSTPSYVPVDSGSESSLDRVRNVELEVTLRFGGRRMQLREILELTPGSVVELDREVHEPVELLLDGHLIARGEVVLVEGNYGLRVTHVTPPAAAV